MQDDYRLSLPKVRQDSTGIPITHIVVWWEYREVLT